MKQVYKGRKVCSTYITSILPGIQCEELAIIRFLRKVMVTTYDSKHSCLSQKMHAMTFKRFSYASTLQQKVVAKQKFGEIVDDSVLPMHNPEIRQAISSIPVNDSECAATAPPNDG